MPSKKPVEIPNPQATTLPARVFAQQMGINPDLPAFDPLGAANQIVLNLMRDGQYVNSAIGSTQKEKAVGNKGMRLFGGRGFEGGGNFQNGAIR